MAHPILRNMFALSVLQVANMVLPLATLPYLFRVLGPDHFGAYVFAQAVIAYLVLTVTLCRESSGKRRRPRSL
jgi:O-antigen/teichoic acid export membrane protein